ncbi:MAG: DUF1188 domain-containing protein [Methanobacterium sp.]|nr:DUF1188 domain-containing protein [Methanobacterium sp.]
MNNYQKGITSEVFTITSQIKVKALMDKIIKKKYYATSTWIKSLNVDIENTVIVGAYLTGSGFSKELKKTSNVTLVDIYPHLENMLGKDVKFSQDIRVIEDADLVIDTTGLGGLAPEMAELINANIFLVEDPTSDGSDELIKGKNNIMDRLKSATAHYKGILRTHGLNFKTSGTMTITMEILSKSLTDALKTPGALYGVAGMEFYEGILFKEKNVDKFLDLLKKPAITVSTLEPFSCDEIINKYMEKLDSQVENVSL